MDSNNNKARHEDRKSDNWKPYHHKSSNSSILRYAALLKKNDGCNYANPNGKNNQQKYISLIVILYHPSDKGNISGDEYAKYDPQPPDFF